MSNLRANNIAENDLTTRQKSRAPGDFDEQMREIFTTPSFVQILQSIRFLGLPDWWLAGGAVRNTVWQRLFPHDCKLVIKDFDVAFFDPLGDRETEAQAKKLLTTNFPDLVFDVKNQASFGVWRNWHFQFNSCEDGIMHWLHTATAVGVRLNDLDQLEVFAPYGLTDLFTGIIRPTPFCVKAKAAQAKKLEYLEKCPALKSYEA